MTNYIVLGSDVYRISLSSVDDKLFSSDTLCKIKDKIRLLDVDLSRVKGDNITNINVLSQIESIIAKEFFSYDNAVLCFYCDYISSIPHTKKSISPQSYRSKLFSRMFDRYISQHKIRGIVCQVISISGINEEFFIHIVFREEHSKYVDILSRDIQEGYEKPTDDSMDIP